MATYSIAITEPHIGPTIPANIEMVAQNDYNCEFRLAIAMQAIHKKYSYNHVNDADSIKLILAELA